MANDAPILLDVTRLIWRRWDGRHPTGVDRVCLAYLDHFKGKAQAVVQHRRMRRILDRETSQALFDLLSDSGASFRKRLVSGALSRGLRGGCEGRGRLYLNLGHTGLNDAGFREWLRTADVRPFFFVHDLIPITHPEFCRPAEEFKHRERMRTVLQTAAGVIANSKATLDALAAFAETEALVLPPTIASLLGADAFPTTVSGSASGPTNFIMLGTIEGRKNHLMLLQVWARMAARLGRDAPRLTVIGKRGWECEQALDLLDRSPALRGVVDEIAHCDDAELARHLAQARALLFPSLAEGYGLPLVEALGSGVPVIASDLPVFREIAGNVPEYLDPLDGPAWERTILNYASPNSPERQSQMKRIKRFRPPTWDDHLEKVESWLRTI